MNHKELEKLYKEVTNKKNEGKFSSHYVEFIKNAYVMSDKFKSSATLRTAVKRNFKVAELKESFYNIMDSYMRAYNGFNNAVPLKNNQVEKAILPSSKTLIELKNSNDALKKFSDLLLAETYSDNIKQGLDNLTNATNKSEMDLNLSANSNQAEHENRLGMLGNRRQPG